MYIYLSVREKESERETGKFMIEADVIAPEHELIVCFLRSERMARYNAVCTREFPMNYLGDFI